MRFGQIEMLYGLWAAAVLALFLSWALKRRTKRAQRFAAGHLLAQIAGSFDRRRQIHKNIFLISVLLFSVLALARPQWGFEWQEIKLQGIDILIMVDTSKSMLTEDVKPNRLERSKLALKDLLKKLLTSAQLIELNYLESGGRDTDDHSVSLPLRKSVKGDRIGLMAFSGSAFLVSPLTVDYGGFLLALEDLNTDTIPRGGTNIAAAIQQAVKEYERTPHPYKAIILMTDGENFEGDAVDAARQAKNKGIKIFTTGIGTREGELIRIQNDQNQLEFLKDDQGNFIKSRLNEVLLQQIAETTDGAYVHASGAQFGLEVIYDDYLSKMEKRDIHSKMQKKYHEHFQIPLGLAFVILLWETCLTTSKKCLTKYCGFFLMMTIVLTPQWSWAASKSSEVKRGNVLYKQQKYNEALEKYNNALKETPDSVIIHFDTGTALYKKKEYGKAVGYFEKSLLSDDPQLEAKGHYNLGNTLYKSAMEKERTNLSSAIPSLEQSLSHYEKSLALNPQDEDAKFNKAFVQKELERIKKKKEQQNSQGNKQEQTSLEESKNQSEQKQKNSLGEQQSPSNHAHQPQAEEGKKDDSTPTQEGQSSDDKEKRGTKENFSDISFALSGGLSEEEAKMLLENYSQNEEPKGLLNLRLQKQGAAAPVLKDW